MKAPIFYYAENGQEYMGLGNYGFKVSRVNDYPDIFNATLSLEFSKASALYKEGKIQILYQSTSSNQSKLIINYWKRSSLYKTDNYNFNNHIMTRDVNGDYDSMHTFISEFKQERKLLLPEEYTNILKDL